MRNKVNENTNKRIDISKLNFSFSLISAKKNRDNDSKINDVKNLLFKLANATINNKKPNNTLIQNDILVFKKLIGNTLLYC